MRPSWTAMASVSEMMWLPLSILAAAGVLLGSVASARTLAERAIAPGACVAETDKIAGPATVQLGESVDITLTVTTQCAEDPLPLHIVLVLDGSGSTAGEVNAELRAGAKELIARLDLPGNPLTRIGVVSFNSSATILCQLTNDASLATECVDRVEASQTTSIDAGILAGLRVIVEGRRGLEVPAEDIREVMVLLTDGVNNAGCAPVQRAAGQASGQGILMVSGCLSGACDVQCMRSVASSPRYYFASRSASQPVSAAEKIGEVLLALQRQLSGNEVRALTVIDRLPTNMAYVPGSARPTHAAISADGREVTWSTANPLGNTFTMSLRVRPLELGRHPTNAGATGTMQDAHRVRTELAFADPIVDVVPAPTQPTPPTSTPRPATATTTPTPGPVPRYVPITLLRGSP